MVGIKMSVIAIVVAMVNTVNFCSSQTPPEAEKTWAMQKILSESYAIGECDGLKNFKNAYSNNSSIQEIYKKFEIDGGVNFRVRTLKFYLTLDYFLFLNNGPHELEEEQGKFRSVMTYCYEVGGDLVEEIYPKRFEF